MKNFKRVKQAIIILVVIFAVSLSTAGATFAASSEDSLADLQKKYQDLENSKKQTDAEINANKNQQTDIKSQINAANKSIDYMQQQINLLNSQIALLSGQIEGKQSDIVAKQKDIDNNYALFKKRIRAMYEAGEVSYLGVLLSSNSVTDFLLRVDAVKKIASHDKLLIKKLSDDKTKIEVDKKAIVDNKNAVTVAKTNQASKQADIKTQQQKRQTLLTQLGAAGQSLEQESDEIEKEMKKTDDDIKKYMAAHRSTRSFVGGIFAWPVPNTDTYISSPFGVNRITHTHSGVDIAGAGINGRPIVAVADGTVVLRQYYGGYGNCIIIDHGGDVSTFYGHQKGFASGISAGDFVSKGQVIGYVGSTGHSTGPHLHFGVMVSGSFVNPLDYQYSGMN